MAEDGEIGFEEGMLWLPSHVLHEAFDTKRYLRHQQNHRQHGRCPKSPAEPVLPLQHSKSGSRAHHRTKFQANWAAGGPGMQAIFLDSGKKSCGTGVFLPRRVGTGFQPSKKPGCSPVLLPSRVVQALNLNISALGLHVSPRQDPKNKSNPKGGDRNLVKNKNGRDLAMQCCVTSQNRNSSPEVFLPKEWTY